MFRAPALPDGRRLVEAVRKWGGLDENSAYFYLLMAERFGATSIVAHDADEGGRGAALRGFVLGLALPDEPEGLFVWQVAVDPATRGEGLGSRMLHRLIERERPRALLAHVAEGNDPSERLFRGVARRLEADCAVEDGFARADFPDNHAAERFFRIGPLSGAR